METLQEDQGLIRYAGLLGHNFVAVVGKPKQRRVLMQCNRLSEAQLRTDDPTLTVFCRRNGRGGATCRWVPCFDRRDKS
jgi:hypothetical protein